jgi:hypothetical protein
MGNQKVMRGLALIALALLFGVQSTAYHVGTLAKAGSGLFPLIISVLLGVIGVVMLVQSRFEPAEPMSFNAKNTLIILASLIGFVLIAEHTKVSLAIVYLVFVSTLAGSDYSVWRNLKISAVLMVIAFAFHTFLGLNLPLL